MRSALLLLVCLIAWLGALGQGYDEFAAFKTAKDINVSLCSGDTNKALKLASRFEQTYPTSAMLLQVYTIVGDIYVARRQYDTALEKLRLAVDVKPARYVMLQRCDTSGSLAHGDFYHLRAEACVALSDIYMRLKMPGSSLSYLTLADSLYHPWKNCGNGYISYRSRLTPNFADVYIALGDTASAIRRLVGFVLSRHGDDVAVARKLREVLLYKHTQLQIAALVDSAIERLNMVNYREGYKKGEIMLYGYKVHYYSAAGNVDDIKAAVRQEPSIKALCGK